MTISSKAVETRSFQSSQTRLAMPPPSLSTVGEAARRSWDTGKLTPHDWVLIPETIGIVARVAVWSGVFCLLLFGLFTYAAPIVGAFVVLVLLARYVRPHRS
jgi:hypothetical protein